MPARSTRSSIVRLGLVSVAAFACAPEQPPKPAASAATTPAATPVITVMAHDYRYEAPDTIEAGMVTIRMVNKGAELHHIILARLTGGKTYADLVEAMKSMKPTDPPPTWLETYAGPNSPMPGGEQSLTQALPPGTYAMICVIPSADMAPHFVKGMMRELTVTPSSAAPAAAPTSDLRVVMNDYGWDLPPTISAGKHVIQLENVAGQEHEMFVVRLEPGKSATDMAAWVEKQAGPPPAAPVGGTSGQRKGTVVYLPVDLTPGRYALLCFIPDIGDHRPHVAHGMLREFTVN